VNVAGFEVAVFRMPLNVFEALSVGTAVVPTVMVSAVCSGVAPEKITLIRYWVL
jgi:hypothetical protein